MVGSAGWLGVAVGATELAIDVVDVGSSGLLFVSVLLEDDNDDDDARIRVDCVRNESCEFADGVMREYDVVDVSVESDVNESDVELFCEGKLMTAELVAEMLLVPLTALVVVELPALVVIVVVLKYMDSTPEYDN